VFTKSEPWKSLSPLLLLAVRRIRHEHLRTMSKNADDGCSLEELSTFHPCFINIFTVRFLKRCGNPITGHFCLSSRKSQGETGSIHNHYPGGQDFPACLPTGIMVVTSPKPPYHLVGIRCDPFADFTARRPLHPYSPPADDPSRLGSRGRSSKRNNIGATF